MFERTVFGRQRSKMGLVDEKQTMKQWAKIFHKISKNPKKEDEIIRSYLNEIGEFTEESFNDMKEFYRLLCAKIILEEAKK